MSVEIVPWEGGIFLVVIRDAGQQQRRVFVPSVADGLDFCRRYLRGDA
jgi:hypothetical protein